MALKDPNLDDMDAVNEALFKFVWNFKHGDNIIYNFTVLQALYAAQANTRQGSIFNKPITILLVSIIEGVLIDFLTRIDQATTHLPANVSRETLDKIKLEIESKKRPEKISDILGEHIVVRRKMYQFGEIIKILQKYELFGNKYDQIYKDLVQFGHLRNRVHIENYYRNFEDRETFVFTDVRRCELEGVLTLLWTKMTNDYIRPW
ncbi:MAG: hypothetical protein ACREBW_05490 [Candidatus Micrarchaeaceae archaeon]